MIATIKQNRMYFQHPADRCFQAIAPFNHIFGVEMCLTNNSTLTSASLKSPEITRFRGFSISWVYVSKLFLFKICSRI